MRWSFMRGSMSDVEMINEGDRVTPRPRGRDWGGYFDAKSRGTLPGRRQPPRCPPIQPAKFVADFTGRSEPIPGGSGPPRRLACQRGGESTPCIDLSPRPDGSTRALGQRRSSVERGSPACRSVAPPRSGVTGAGGHCAGDGGRKAVRAAGSRPPARTRPNRGPGRIVQSLTTSDSRRPRCSRLLVRGRHGRQHLVLVVVSAFWQSYSIGRPTSRRPSSLLSITTNVAR